MKYFIILLLSPLYTLSQIAVKGYIVNSKREPLPLTNIVSQKKNIGTITNEEGLFILNNISIDDTIKITNVAFVSKLIAIKDISFKNTIVLSDKIIELDAVVVKSYTSFRDEKELGFYKYANNGEFKLIPGNQLAVYIKNQVGKEGWIKEVIFKIKNFGKCKNSIRIRLIKPDITTGQPAHDVLNENVLIDYKKMSKSNSIDLSSYKILIPKEGIFVVIEWLYPDENCNTVSYTSISANLSLPENLVYLNFRDKAWIHSRPRVLNGNYMTPNIGLKVAY